MRDPGAGEEGEVHGGGGGGEADAGHADHREASVRDKTTAGPSYAGPVAPVLLSPTHLEGRDQSQPAEQTA